MSHVLSWGRWRLWCASGEPENSAAFRAAYAANDVDGVYVSQAYGFNADSLGFLLELGPLRALKVYGAGKVDFSCVSQLDSLELLGLDGGTGEVRLDRMQRLSELWLALRPGLNLPAQGLPNVETLMIWHAKCPDLSFLYGYPRLVTLSVTQMPKLETLAGLEHCPQLQELSVCYCPKLVSTDGIATLRSLRKLEFHNDKRIGSYASLRYLADLRGLKLNGCAPIADLDFLAQLPRLESVVIRKTPVLSKDLSPLLHLPELIHAYLDRTQDYGPLPKQIEQAAATRQAQRSSDARPD